MRPNVLDISHHNTISSFAALATFGILGVINKSSQGSGYVDPTYEKNREDVLSAGMLFGAYHFMTADDAVAQVQHFFNAAKPDASTLMAFDYEPNKENSPDMPTLIAALKEYEQRAGKKAVLYSGNLLNETLKDASDEDRDYLAQHRLWIARYSDDARRNMPPWTQVWPLQWLHQFSGDGVNSHGIIVPGISGLIDMNFYAQSPEQLKDEWN